jgi:hypothetical protein
MLQRYLQNSASRLLALRVRLIIPALKQQLLLSRDRKGAVLFADSAEFCKYLFSLPC